MSSKKPLGEASEELAQIFKTLRGPSGCAWNRAQTLQTLKTFWLEETSEALEALNDASANINPENSARLRDELGDVLLQIAFLATIAEEAGLFTFAEVVENLNAKLRRRHPHIFGGERANTPEAVARLWERVKQEEKASKPQKADGALQGVPKTMPALARAQSISAKAAALGFEWPSVEGVFDKMNEEMLELREAMQQPPSEKTSQAVEHELGDVLFTLCNIARFLHCSAEDALRQCISRFERRFGWIEARLKERGQRVEHVDMNTLEALWQDAKKNLA